jgi:hypothetical protein
MKLLGLNDPRVAYWEPAKFVAKLRELKTDDNPLLLKTDMSSGHCKHWFQYYRVSVNYEFSVPVASMLTVSASDRYKFIKESAHEYAFILDQVHKQPAQELFLRIYFNYASMMHPFPLVDLSIFSSVGDIGDGYSNQMTQCSLLN